jgi:hypothetical protein
VKCQPEGAIAVIEIPHQRPAKLYWYESRQDFVDQTTTIAADAGDDIDTFEQAVDYAGSDLNCLLVIEDDADVDRMLKYSGHQRGRVEVFAQEIKTEFRELLDLDELKDAVKADREWQTQRGPDDTAGYERDQETCDAVDDAETLEELVNVAPASWSAAITNRCHRNQL